MKRIAIVILNWNGADMLCRFLPSVVKYSPEADVAVIDNGSTDRSLQYLREEMPQVRIISLDKNYGFAEGYHRGLKAMEEDTPSPYSGRETASLMEGQEESYYLLLNSDVEVREGWLGPMLSYMDSHPEVAACQPKLLCQWAPDMFEYAGASGGYLDALGYPYCRGRVFGRVEKDEGQYDGVVPVLWATGAALLIRRHDYWDVGGLDGRFFAHQEEIDLCWRLRSRGRGVVCVPQSVAYHLGGGTLPQGNPRKDYLNFRNNLLLLYKNLPKDRLWKVMLLRFWLDALASVRFILRGQFRSFLAVWRARFDFWCLLPQFRKDREANLRMAKLKSVPEQSCFSLLWQYHVKGRKTFSALPPTLRSEGAGNHT